MTDSEVKIFIDCLTGFFGSVSGTDASSGVPYVKNEGESVLLNYTGVIGISGKRKGCLYITCDRDMLADCVSIFLGEEQPSEIAIKDMVGEIANTVAGNARESFGMEFLISVPIIINGKPKNVELPLEIPTYVIPINWKQYQSFLVVGIE